ncbi:basic helix-loop-helix (bHLH) DNA-bindingsuperfamily protein, partial [Striga asiatica]
RGGLASGEEERFSAGLFEQQKKVDNWEVDGQQVLNLNSFSNFLKNNINNDNNNNNNNNNNDVINGVVDHVKQECSSSCQLYNDHINNHIDNDHQFHNNQPNRSNWPHHHQVLPVSSPTSCVTTLSNNNFLNFSCNAAAEAKSRHHNQEHTSECNSTSTGGVSKKARVQQSSAQPALKVRKEKLGDRITALHQLVSPFGKTDTASVLSEAIGYIRFLQGQIEALSSPYMRNASVNSGHHHHSVQERACLFSQEAASQGMTMAPIIGLQRLLVVAFESPKNVAKHLPCTTALACCTTML